MPRRKSGAPLYLRQRESEDVSRARVSTRRGTMKNREATEHPCRSTTSTHKLRWRSASFFSSSSSSSQPVQTDDETTRRLGTQRFFQTPQTSGSPLPRAGFVALVFVTMHEWLLCHAALRHAAPGSRQGSFAAIDGDGETTSNGPREEVWDVAVVCLG